MNHRKITRRTFVQGAGAAYVITSTALGTADKPPASKRITMGPKAGSTLCEDPQEADLPRRGHPPVHDNLYHRQYLPNPGAQVDLGPGQGGVRRRRLSQPHVRPGNVRTVENMIQCSG